MDARKPKPNQKRRQNKNDNCLGPQRKSQRLLDKNKQPVKITDLNDDCLDKIFEHLDSSDLFNVAVANEWLRPAAGAVYNRKFGKKTVWIYNRKTSVTGTLDCNDRIYVFNLKRCLQYLRCLGPSISSLGILYGCWNEKQCDHIHQYIGQYCAGSLVSIEFVNNANSLPIKHFDTPFVNVPTVKVHASNMASRISAFPQWFPNLRSLELNRIPHFPPYFSSPLNHVEVLRIDVNEENVKRAKAKIANVARLIQMCPQLHTLDISMRIGALNALSKIIKNGPNIRNLKVTIKSFMAPVNQSSIQQFVNALAHPTFVALKFNRYKFKTEAAVSLIHQISSLKKFQFEIKRRSEYERIVSQLDSQWQPSFYKHDETNYVELER